MEQAGPVGGGRPPADQRPGEPDAVPPDLAEAIRQLGDTGRASVGAAGDVARALRTLVVADVSLARSAAGRSLAFTGVAIAAGASAWLLLMGVLVSLLRGAFEMSWLLAMLLPALLSVAITGIAGWRAMHYFEHTRLQATRRQLARLGIGELADFMPAPESPESARRAADMRPPTDATGAPMKDGQGIDVTPP